MRICVKNGHRTAPKFPGLFLTLWGFLCLSSFSYLEDLPRPKEREEKKARDWCRISRCWKCLNKQTHRHASWHCRQSPESPPFINPDMNEPKCGCIWSVWDALATYEASIQQLQHILRLLSLPMGHKDMSSLYFHLGLLLLLFHLL